MHICDNCGSPFAHSPLYGRPWPQQPPAIYCCYGCLTWGEQRRFDQAATSTGQKSDTSIPPTLGIRLGISAVITAQIMIFGTAINLHKEVSENVYNIVIAIILLSTIVVIALLGNSLIINTVDSLYKRKITIESLFTITLIGAFIASIESYITGKGYIYFEVIPILLIIYNIGNLIVAQTRSKAMRKISTWYNQIRYAHKITGHNVIEDVPVDSIEVNDVVQVGPGEMIPIDGRIVDGTAYVFAGYVRGEPFPVTRTVGEPVVAGEIVYDAIIKVQATSKGTQRQIDNIINTLNNAFKKDSFMNHISDNLSKWFVPLIIFISLTTFIYWIQKENYPWHVAFYHSMSVLLVACPCVLGITVPLLQWLAINKLAENGIVTRSRDIIEKLAKINYVIFDKTGTLTNLDNYEIHYISYVNDKLKYHILSAIYHIEKSIKHPIAQLLANITKVYSDNTIRILEAKQIPGCGIEAKLIMQNTPVSLHIGSYQWIQSLIDCTQSGTIHKLQYDSKGIYILYNYKLSLVITFLEKIASHSFNAFTELKSMNIKTAIMTGDNDIRINLPETQVFSGLLPLDKQHKVTEIRKNGYSVLYVGDGINDTTALAAADVSFAVASGVDLAIQASDAILYNKDLRVIPWAIAYSCVIVQAIRRSLLRALIYNLIGICLAACGYLHPVVAILLMTISSISLILAAVYLDHSNHCIRPIGISNIQYTYKQYLYITILHFISFIAQGLIIIQLIDNNIYDILIVSCYIIFGAIFSYLWYKWEKIPHYLDMIFGMLTLGNLGMLLGWWYDAVNSGIHYCSCCHTNNSSLDIFSGMYIGMLIFSNIAMFLLSRYPLYNRLHKLAMLLGGNIGMVYGMYLGVKLVIHYLQILPDYVISHYLSMSLGMIIGMVVGTYVVEKILIIALRIFYILIK